MVQEQLRHMPLEEILKEQARLREDRRGSQLRTVLILFASTFLLLFWYSAVYAEPVSPAFLRYRYLFLAPILANVWAWMIWASPLTRRFRRSDSVFQESPPLGQGAVC
jgi:hypothetical protein